MGSIDSPKAQSMLDAVEYILMEEGYASLTSRRIAEHLDIKQRLLYYYFKTMDELALESFKRLAVRELERLETALESDQPLREIWQVCIHTSDARLISEYMALANRNAGIRNEVIAYIEKSRGIQVRAIKRALKRQGLETTLPADAIAFLGSSVALALNREEYLGVKKAHKAVLQTFSRFLDELEPDS